MQTKRNLYNQYERHAADCDELYQIFEEVTRHSNVSAEGRQKFRNFYVTKVRPGMRKMIYSNSVAKHISNTGHLDKNIVTFMRDYERVAQEQMERDLGMDPEQHEHLSQVLTQPLVGVK